MKAHPAWMLRALLFSLLLVGPLVACGSDDDDPTATVPAAVSTPTTAAVAAAATETTVPATVPAATAAPSEEPATATTAPPTASTLPPTPAATATEEAASTTPQLPVTVTDASGVEVTITDVSRIVALTGDVAEIVWALGLGELVVGTDSSSTYPAEAAALQNIGYQRTLAAEGILSLNPTVIIGGEAAGPPEVLEQLRGAGVPVVIISDPASLEAPALKIRAVAEALGVPAAGDALATTVQAEIDDALALAATATSQPTVLFLYVRGTATQMIGGVGSVADILITAAGGIDAGVEAGIMGFQPLTAESLVAAQPDVLLLLTAGLESVGSIDGLLQIPGVAQTPAAQEQRILDYDDLYLIGMGPRTGQALHDLILGLHPELDS